MLFGHFLRMAYGIAHWIAFRVAFRVVFRIAIGTLFEIADRTIVNKRRIKSTYLHHYACIRVYHNPTAAVCYIRPSFWRGEKTKLVDLNYWHSAAC